MSKSVVSSTELVKAAAIYLLTYVPKHELMEELQDLKEALNHGNISIQFAVGYVTQTELASKEVLKWVEENKKLNS